MTTKEQIEQAVQGMDLQVEIKGTATSSYSKLNIQNRLLWLRQQPQTAEVDRELQYLYELQSRA